MKTAFIFHIASETDLQTAKNDGVYRHQSQELEGFIHCCLEHQVAGVLERYFETTEGFVKLKIDTNLLDPDLIMENTVGGEELFPHVYGDINMDAVVDVLPLP